MNMLPIFLITLVVRSSFLLDPLQNSKPEPRFLTYANNLPPDTGFSPDQIITKYGYPVEIHDVVTKDGYILRLFRIPNGRQGSKPNKPVVLFQSGFLCDAGAFVMMGPKQGLGFLLADRGYDVWLTNLRGTTHSRRHTKLNPDISCEYWKFSFTEFGIYDNTAFIDYILNYTNQPKLNYVSHSQGGMNLFTLLSERPDYNQKINLGLLLAPSVYITNSKMPVIQFGKLPGQLALIDAVFKVTGICEVLPNNAIIRIFMNTFCSRGIPTQLLCAWSFSFVGGPDDHQLDPDMIPVISSHIPAGVSAQQIQHFHQLAVFGVFQKFDYGRYKNKEVYGQETPPKYNLAKAIIPFVLLSGADDIIVVPEDMKHLATQLKNLVAWEEISKTNHLDFMYGIDSKSRIYDKVFKYLDKYNPTK